LIEGELLFGQFDSGLVLAYSKSLSKSSKSLMKMQVHRHTCTLRLACSRKLPAFIFQASVNNMGKQADMQFSFEPSPIL
jgi:hypothetical protein